jgi:hypothetical protein
VRCLHCARSGTIRDTDIGHSSSTADDGKKCGEIPGVLPNRQPFDYMTVSIKRAGEGIGLTADRRGLVNVELAMSLARRWFPLVPMF